MYCLLVEGFVDLVILDSQLIEEFITFLMDSEWIEEFITFLGDCGIPETNGGENDYQTNGSTPETSCNFNT